MFLVPIVFQNFGLSLKIFFALFSHLHYVCLGKFIKERDSKEICYFYSLDEERNKKREKYDV
jgi:hypothetical protein